MGRGILTRTGADPLDQWSLRIQIFDSPELSEVLQAFLGGETVTAVEGELEVSALKKGPNEHRISIRLPRAPYLADIRVQAVEIGDVKGAEADTRSAIPSPDGWIVDTQGETSTTWELFNCVVISLQSRRNKP